MSKLSAKINISQAFESNITTLDVAFKDDVMTAKNNKQYVPLEALLGKRWICVDDLTGDHFFHKQNKDVQLQLDINEKRAVDTYGHTHSISWKQSKETRESGATKKYCGDAKEITFNKPAATAATVTAESIIAAANLEKLDEVDEIEF